MTRDDREPGTRGAPVGYSTGRTEGESFAAALRARAEQQASQLAQQTRAATLEGLAPEAAARLLHELQVHQLELEMQNEELRRAHDALAESRDRYFRLYDLAPVGYLTLDAAGVVVEANLTAAAMLGVERTELLTRPWTSFIAAEDQDTWYLKRRAALKQGDGVSFELGLVTADQRPRWVLMDLKPVPGAASGDQSSWAALSDITERRQTEQALGELQAELAALQEGGSLASLLVDQAMHGRTLSGRTAHGTPASTSGGALVRSVEAKLNEALRSHHEGHSTAARATERCGACAVRAAVSTTFRTHEGQRQVEVTLPVPVEGARPLDRTFLLSTAYLTLNDEPRVLLSAVDITERRRLAAELAQAQKMEAVGNLAGGVAHEFNNALAVILANAELLGEQLAPGTRATEDVAEIVGAAKRASAMTRQLLAYSRKQVMVPIPFDLRVAAPGLARLMRTHLGHGIALRFELPDGLGRLLVDPAQLEQVLANLMVNARDAMPTGGEVVISADNVEVSAQDAARPGSLASGRYVRLRVKDTGCGMTEDVASQLFEPFFTTKPFGKGTGLGLAIVHGIVTQSGGRIDVESKAGHGTTFILHLPRGDDAAAPPPATDEPRRPQAPQWSGLVLLVDDDTRVRAPIRRLLTRLGFEVEEAASGDEALRKFSLRPSSYRFVLTDVGMPGMNGFELARQLDARQPSVKVIFMSGNFDETAKPAEVGATAQRHLAKPFSGVDLAAIVGELLGTAGSS